jgi:hypothetical protein
MITLGGCGGGNERLSAPAFAREASKVCRRGNHAVVRIDIPPLTASGASSRAIARVVVVQRDMIDDLRSVRPPDAVAAIVQKWIALLDQGTDELELMGLRLHAEHTADAADYGAKATMLLGRAREVVAPLRVTSCRGPVLPTA